jgi:hypothetical protein
VFAAAAAGCSGGSGHPAAVSPTPSPSITVPGLISSTGPVPASYLGPVDAACADSIAQLRRRGPAPQGPADPNRLTPQQLRAAAPFLQQGATIQLKAAATVARFPNPPSGVDQWRVYREAVQQYADGTQAEATAAKAGQPQVFVAAARRLLALRTKVLESGLAVGLGAGTACSRLF